MMKTKLLMTLFTCIVIASCATVATGPEVPTNAEIAAALKSSFKETATAKLDRLDQSELQRACSVAAETGKDLDPKVREALQAKALAGVKYPADGKYLGDWKRGESIAQSGRGHSVQRCREYSRWRQLLRLSSNRQSRNFTRQHRPDALELRKAARPIRTDSEIHLGARLEFACI